ncbi:MAG: protein phosphatase 2C domain-containing protein [Anaerolineales bacterium]|nr:protein phosphatase 2C domain-containing protein [Anaerolineales bacterium]
MRFSKSFPIKAAAITHAGISGKINEDRFRLHRFLTKNQEEAVLAVVADGIGGHRAGEVAAELATEQIVRSIEEQNIEQPVYALKQAIHMANQIVLAGAQSNPQWAGMGSTCACALVLNNRLYTASAGDSRIYLLRGKRIFQLNRDHTWIQEAIDLGALPPATAHLHPNAHVIRRYIGAPNGVQPDTRLFLEGTENDQQAEANQGLKLRPGDQIVVCSDGLTDLVAAHEILYILQNRPLMQALEELVNLANQRGGHDNITIVGLQIRNTPSPALRWIVGVIFFLLAFGLISFLTLSYFGGNEDLLRSFQPTSRVTASIPITIAETPLFPTMDASEEDPLPIESPVFTLSPSSPLPPSLSSTATFTPWPTNTPEP